VVTFLSKQIYFDYIFFFPERNSFVDVWQIEEKVVFLSRGRNRVGTGHEINTIHWAPFTVFHQDMNQAKLQGWHHLTCALCLSMHRAHRILTLEFPFLCVVVMNERVLGAGSKLCASCVRAYGCVCVLGWMGRAGDWAVGWFVGRKVIGDVKGCSGCCRAPIGACCFLPSLKSVCSTCRTWRRGL
jgi:hypothetical protein